MSTVEKNNIAFTNDKQNLNKLKTQELCNLWQEGINSGSAGSLNMAEIKLEARQHYE